MLKKIGKKDFVEQLIDQFLRWDFRATLKGFYSSSYYFLSMLQHLSNVDCEFYWIALSFRGFFYFR